SDPKNQDEMHVRSRRARPAPPGAGAAGGITKTSWSDEHERPDVEDGTLLGDLWGARVGRRPVGQAGVASALGLGVGSRALLGAGEAAAKPKPEPKKKRRRTTRVDLHFAYGHVRGVSHLVAVVHGKHVRLVRHTKASRAALRKRGGLYRAMDLR